MKVYEVIKSCVISYRDKDNRANEFCLNEGDFFFVKENIGWSRVQTGTYSYDKYESCDLLVKIYYQNLNMKKAIIDGIKEYTWTWEDINILDPVINKKFAVKHYQEFCPDLIKDVTMVWDRDEKLSNLLGN